MKYNTNGYRFRNYYKWEYKKYSEYDYQRDGLLKHLLPKIIVESQNPILKFILNYVETSLIFLMKYVDKLKNFKNIHWKNR